MMTDTLKKPAWIRARIPSGETWKHLSLTVEKYRLHTVCDEAHCPNKGECWGAGTAAFMILGDLCTRSCRFCAVATARKGREPDPGEGDAIANAVEELGLRYVVLTSVDRDDLPDRGAGHFAACAAALKRRRPDIGVEVLIPDYTGAELEPVLAAAPEVIAHNVETVPSLQWVRDSRASFAASLNTLQAAKARGAARTKTSLILGFGETGGEVLATMDALRGAGVDILVLGQYLRPGPKQLPVAEYLSPARFDFYAAAARERGFSSVIASPLARTSYHAEQAVPPARPFPEAPGAGGPGAG